MSGRFKGSFNPKNPKANKAFNSEVLKEDSQVDNVVKKPATFSLKGILGLGQSVEINKPATSHESFFGLNHLAQEQNILFDQRQRELKQAIEDLRLEIKKLAQSTSNISTDVIRIADSNVIDANSYQISVLTRIKNFIIDMRKNINEASLWMEAFANKKKKKNMFWNKVKNKKQGGDQYLFSNEHSAARSVN
jgi:hypothetical protein